MLAYKTGEIVASSPVKQSKSAKVALANVLFVLRMRSTRHIPSGSSCSHLSMFRWFTLRVSPSRSVPSGHGGGAGSNRLVSLQTTQGN